MTGDNRHCVACPLIIGASTGFEAPYPLQMEGKVISGFGRGSKELGIPTANLPIDDNLTPWIADIKSGVYFGWASLRLPPSHPNRTTTPEFIVYPPQELGPRGLGVAGDGQGHAG